MEEGDMKRSWLWLVLSLSGFLVFSLVASCGGDDDDDDNDNDDAADDDDDTTDDDTTDDDDDTGGEVCSECVDYFVPCLGEEDANASCDVFWAEGEMSPCEKIAQCHLWECQLDKELDCADYDLENPDIEACVDAYQAEIEDCD
jgi:hypothetical protein